MHIHKPGNVVGPTPGHRTYSHRAVVFSLEVLISIRVAAFGHPGSFMVFISLAYKLVKPSSSSSFDRHIRARSPFPDPHFDYSLVTQSRPYDAKDRYDVAAAPLKSLACAFR
jgi:hypothetical protein